MGVTKNGLPYPEQTDSVDVVRDVKALAESVDLKKARVEVRSQSGAVPPAGAFPLVQAFPGQGNTDTNGILPVTWLVPFAVPPIVHASVVAGSGTAPVINGVASVTTTGCQVIFPGQGNKTMTINVIAVGWIV